MRFATGTTVKDFAWYRDWLDVAERAGFEMLTNKERSGDEAGARISRSILYLAEHMHEVPVLVFPCYDLPAATTRYGTLLSPERAPTAMRSDQYASIYPAVWSFQLAARSRGQRFGHDHRPPTRPAGDGGDSRHPHDVGPDMHDPCRPRHR